MESTTDLWNSVKPGAKLSVESSRVGLPFLAKKYLAHALAKEGIQASAIKLEMDGEIKLNKAWLPFKAVQVITNADEFIWSAKVKSGLMRISGFDRLIGGKGEMNWKMFGLFPVMAASGADITRAAAGRLACEYVWLPNCLAASGVAWRDVGPDETSAGIQVAGSHFDLRLTLKPNGGLSSMCLDRWGNPDGEGFALRPFGGYVDEESTFSGMTIPTKLRVGWHVGTGGFEDGEFFRCQLTDVEFK